MAKSLIDCGEELNAACKEFGKALAESLGLYRLLALLMDRLNKE